MVAGIGDSAVADDMMITRRFRERARARIAADAQER